VIVEMKTKSDLREHFLALRRAITPGDRARWNDQIRARLFQLPEMQGHDDVYIYVSTDDEVDTRAIMEELLRCGRRVLTPIARGAGRMDWGLITSLGQLRPGRFGVAEAPAVTQGANDLHRGVAIVPCVAFTAGQNRLGRGGGYYDRFLATFAGATIALAYEVQRAEVLPVDTHDVKTQRVLTELGFYPA
jgi:5-formyltetrahydrofolate cyclo-ligase